MAAVTACAITGGDARATAAEPRSKGLQRTCRVAAFDGLLTLYARVLRADGGGRPAATTPSPAWTEFERAAGAILGLDTLAADDVVSRERLPALLAGGRETHVPCDAGSVTRDRLAYRLALVGYSAREITAMVLGQASRAEVDAEYARGLAGLGRASPLRAGRLAAEPVSLPARVAAAVFRTPPAPARVRADSGATDELTAWIRHYSGFYGVDSRLVTAVIQCESGWNAASVSPKGAIGLMQLMPDTASMLKVDPRDSRENIRGGVAYLADLLRTYGDVRHALIAYNAGPSHANQVIRGERALFSETQRYLDAIAVLYPLGGEQ